MNILENIAKDISKHKLIPFFGSGVSFEHLHLNWDILCSKMNIETGINEKDNLTAAQNYVDQFGKDNFVNFLKNYLLINDFNDVKGESILFLLAVNSPHYYTTNQDNVFEKCMEKYGRKYQNISTIETFQEDYPNITTIFKFHGDLDYPESIIFTKTDYQKRMPNEKELSSFNPLDIMLIADTISRGCLFIGYSFRDPNIDEIFKHISAIFNGNPPKSYLIEYEPSIAFEEKLKKYNIECINGTKFFTSVNKVEAYSSVLSFLLVKSFEYRTKEEIADLFSPNKYSIIPILTFYELDKFNEYIKMTTDKIDVIIEKYRALADIRNIPKDFSNFAGEILKKMIVSINNKESLQNIGYALHNAYISDISVKCEIMIEYYYKLNDFLESDALGNIHLYNVHMQNIPSNCNIFFAAAALERLGKDKKNTYNLLKCLTYSISSISDIEDLEPDAQEYIKNQFDIHYSTEKTLRNPLNGPKLFFGKRHTYENILENLTKMMPKEFE